jgi:hypothetical protein
LTGAASDFDSMLEVDAAEGKIASTERSTTLFFEAGSPAEVFGAPADKVNTGAAFIASHFLFCLAAVMSSDGVGTVESRGGL